MHRPLQQKRAKQFHSSFPTVSVRAPGKVRTTGSVVGPEVIVMYTGELINGLLESVEDAERKVFVRIGGAESVEDSKIFGAQIREFGTAKILEWHKCQ